VIDILDKRYYFTEQKKAKLRENISICDWNTLERI
jgi:hypothetical protein